MTAPKFMQQLAGFALATALAAAPALAQDRPTVAVVATGGTIAMKVDPVTHAPVPAVSGEDLIAAVPHLKEIANVQVVEFSNIPSDYMGPDRWPSLTKKVEEVLADPTVRGVVISHGTDTLDQTAYFLDLTLKAISRSLRWAHSGTPRTGTPMARATS